jgi:hypothetical protein
MTALPSVAGSVPMPVERTRGQSVELSSKTLAWIGGSMLTIALGLVASTAECAGKRAVDTTIANVATVTSVNELRAAVDNRIFRDSMALDYRLQAIERRVTTTDSILRCMRATQLKRPVCE